MRIIVYEWDGVILTHAVLAGHTAKADYYCRFLWHSLRLAIRRKIPCLIVNIFPIVLHDNALYHIANSVTLLLRRRLTIKNLRISSLFIWYKFCDFHLFLKLTLPRSLISCCFICNPIRRVLRL